ncbi:hypothetical protein DQ353_21005, partial [Arthrobacter sp. AQ5-05]|uniref:HNH endonuclease signature motif containing protein n=1 Tax=Arthrobacter sp. AQ5-05 TaxID=2184581 RepID=UPI000DCDBC3A
METRQLIDALTTTGGEPGHPVSPVDKLRLLAALELRAADLAAELAAEITSPTQAALLAHTVERAHQRGETTQLRAARAAQRTLVQDLGPGALDAVRSIAADPAAFIAGHRDLPADPATVPTGIMPFKDTAGFLEHDLRIPRAVALHRLHAANALLPGTDVHGNTVGPRYPRLAEQLESGAARLGPVSAAARRLDKFSHTIARQPGPEDLAARIEEKVAGSVAAGIPKDTARLLAGIGDELDQSPDAGAPSPEEIRERTGIVVTKRTRHYTHFSACMLNADAEVFLSHFAAADNPRTLAGNRQGLAASATGMNPAAGNGTGNAGTATADASGKGTGNPGKAPDGQVPGPDPGTETAPAAAPPDGPDWFTRPANAETFPDPDPDSPPGPGTDGLTAAQRHLQVLLNLMRAPHAAPPRGTAGLPTAQLVIHCRLETLLGLAKGNGWSAHGLEIPIGEVRRRLATDGVIPLVLGGQSEVLDVGREMRLANDTIRRAVLARDGGCFYPGCSVPPEHLEMCHIDGWAAGGGTSVAGLTPGCACHHHMADNGLLHLLVHNGLPHVLLPRHLDPEQIPRRNSYWPQNQTTLF